MAKIKEIIVEAVLPAVKTIGKIQMQNVLLSIKHHNTAAMYQGMLRGLHANFSLLKEAASRSSTKVDDGIIDLVLEAVKENADADEIILL